MKMSEGFNMDTPEAGSKFHDDDRKLKRTVWTASAHVITAVIGSGVLFLALAVAQLGWVAGPAVMFLFSFVTYYTSSLLSHCYRSGDLLSGKRNYTYMDAVRSTLVQYKVCGVVQYLNLFGIAMGYTIASSISMMALKRSNCFHASCGKGPCRMNSNPFVIAFEVVEIIFSEIKNFHQLWWLSILAAVMSFTYSYAGSWAVFYMMCGCMGYAAFGDMSSGNLLTGFGFYNPYWLLDIANAAIVIHLVGAYQVYCQPLFAFVEKAANARSPLRLNLNLFRMIWGTIFEILTLVVSMLLPFFNDAVWLLGALGFWPLTVYFQVDMYIRQKGIAKWSTKWMCLQVLSLACLIVTIAVAAGSVAGVVLDLKDHKPFKTTY